MIKSFSATAALLSLATLAGASPALGSAFTAPRTLADWGAGGDTLAVAPGAAAWSHPTGVRISRDGGDPLRIPGEGLVQDMDIATAGGEPVAAWADSGARLHAFTGRETIVTGTMDGIRKVAATPAALAWIGIPAGEDRRVQIATRRGGEAFSAARTPEQLGEPVFGTIAAAGRGARSLFAWSAHDGGDRRIELLTVDAHGGSSEARWVTGPGEYAGTPAVALGPDGAGVLAWTAGAKARLVTAMPVTADGTLGAPQVLDPEAGGPPDVAVGPGGAAVVLWPAAGRLRLARRAPGAQGFAAPVTLPAENVAGWSAAITQRGETIVSWLDAPPGAEGAQLLAAVAPPGGGLGSAEALAGRVSRVGGAGDELTWVESRPDGPSVNEHRVRSARLLPGAAPGEDGAPGGGVQGDRRAPRVKLRVLGVRGRRVRVAVRADERAALRATWRRGARTLRRTGGTLRADRARVLRLTAPAGARRVTLAVKVTDAAGNAATAKRAVRLRKNGA